ncbi:MAG: cytochrome c maturation protein CcmE [Nitrospinae bacterium]|nr:cytochrome c maturation protein CcmE [Nitrospinota bacterium]
MVLKKKQIKFLVGSLAILLAVIYLVITGISKTSVYYLTVSELKTKGESIYGEGVRVSGKVVEGSIQRDPASFRVDFKITDDYKDIEVSYVGIVPDLFKEGREVVVEGKIDPTGLFKATTLLTNCPSKYKPEVTD